MLLPGWTTERAEVQIRAKEALSQAQRDRPLKSALGKDRRPALQQSLILHGIRQPYTLTDQHPRPQTREPDELVVRVLMIGLNPVDWKSVDYGFGIPQLPYIAGRDFAGVVVEAPRAQSDIEVGDVVSCPSTDYRDPRKAAYQQYAVARQSNVWRLPPEVPMSKAAATGVAYVAAVLCLSVCLGVELPSLGATPAFDLLKLVRSLPSDSLPVDIRDECLRGVAEYERPHDGDWIAIWGGSSTTALFVSQMASMAGLKVILVADTAKHGARLKVVHGGHIVDSHQPDRAVEIIRSITGGRLRYAIDTVGKETATTLAKCLAQHSAERTHLVGLAGLPISRNDNMVFHSVPMKLFHEIAEVGDALMEWLEVALAKARLTLPEVTVIDGGLSAVNEGLDQMRKGLVSGRRLVVSIS